MTPAEFRTLARHLAGPRWKTQLGPMVGRNREAVWAYAKGEREVPKPVEKLMRLLSQSTDSQSGKETPT
jgi:RNase adaptor protein for sRNA GlmZ degradation